MVDSSLGASAQVENLKEAISHRFHVAPENIEFTYVCYSYLLFCEQLIEKQCGCHSDQRLEKSYCVVNSFATPCVAKEFTRQ